MTTSEPLSRLPTPPSGIQPWAIGLFGVVAILVLLVAVTL
jgi:hypothetical protein